MIMELISGAAFSGAVLASARWTWWRGHVPGLPVLTYSKVGFPPEGSTLKDSWVAPDKFRSQISWLLANGYSTLLFSDLIKARNGGRKTQEKQVLITFDGAYEATYTHAYGILSELGAKGNIFTAFNTIGKANLWQDPVAEPWINMATLDMMREMQESGLVEFGSHTMNHPYLETLPAEDAAWELTESKKQLESALRRMICAFSYPFGSGAGSPALRAQVIQAGYTLDFGSEQGKATWPWRSEDGPLPRITIRRGDNNLDLKLKLTRGASRLF